MLYWRGFTWKKKKKWNVMSTGSYLRMLTKWLNPWLEGKDIKKLCMGRARSPMWLTASRQTAQNSIVNRQKSLFFTVNRQKCRLILMVEKSQFISNLPISADLHGLLAPEESLNWKNCSQFSNIISPDIIRPYTLLIHNVSENLITTVNANLYRS